VSVLLARGLRSLRARGRGRARLRIRLSPQPRLRRLGRGLRALAQAQAAYKDRVRVGQGVSKCCRWNPRRPVRILISVSSSSVGVQHAPPRQSPRRNEAGMLCSCLMAWRAVCCSGVHATCARGSRCAGERSPAGRPAPGLRARPPPSPRGAPGPARPAAARPPPPPRRAPRRAPPAPKQGLSDHDGHGTCLDDKLAITLTDSS
jgi:hypothetical protein